MKPLPLILTALGVTGVGLLVAKKSSAASLLGGGEELPDLAQAAAATGGADLSSFMQPTSAPPAAKGGGLPLAISNRMGDAAATGDPDILRAEARNLMRDGYTFEAAQLEGLARAYEAATGQEPTQPDLPIPPAASPVDALPAPKPSDAVDPRQTLALATALALANIVQRGRITQERSSPATIAMVKTYQAQEQPDAGAVDGKYGPKTALTFIDYGVIPPKPFYWPSSNTQAAITAYRQVLLDQAKTDKDRAVDWGNAAKAIP